MPLLWSYQGFSIGTKYHKQLRHQPLNQLKVCSIHCCVSIANLIFLVVGTNGILLSILLSILLNVALTFYWDNIILKLTIHSIVIFTQVNSAWRIRDKKTASHSSKRALQWNIASIITGVIICIAYIAFRIITLHPDNYKYSQWTLGTKTWL